MSRDELLTCLVVLLLAVAFGVGLHYLWAWWFPWRGP